MRQFALTALIATLALVVVGDDALRWDFRVTPGYGDRSRAGTVRLTYVGNMSAAGDPAFDAHFSYNRQFRYRWTDMRVHTTLLPVGFNAATAVSLPGSSPFTVNLPAPGQGVRGIMVGDICYYAAGIATCENADADGILARLPDLLDGILSDPTFSFWALMGDNFYDGTGHVSRNFWSTLTPTAKSKLFLTVPGNWDFWSSGDPKDIDVPHDQFGNGFMQFYGMDTQASALSGSTGAPWNFTVNPDEVGTGHHKGKDVPNQQYLPDPSNFQYYNQVGNLGFIAYSGAHHHKDVEPFFHEACGWMNANRATIDWIILIGHWAKDTKGASDKTTVPAAYQYLISYGCPQQKLKYFEGHTHCNMIAQQNVGFLVGAFGKADSHCNQFGIPIIDSTGGRLLVVYFPISEAIVPTPDHPPHAIVAGTTRLGNSTDRYLLLQGCINKGSIMNCLHLEHQVWLNETAAKH